MKKKKGRPSNDEIAARPLKDSLGKWYLAVNPEYHYVSYQQEIVVPTLERLERREGKRKLMLALPPGHSKSDLATRAFVSWYLGRHPNHNAMTLSYSQGIAVDFGKDIRNICTREDLLLAFPGLELTRDSRSNQVFTTVQNNHYYAVGFDGKITSRRLDLLCIDDPVRNFDEADSEVIMASRFKTYRSAARPRMRPNGIMVASLTRYGLRDFAARVLEAEEDEWDILCLPAEDDYGTFLWEEFYGRDHYLNVKKDQEVWWALYQQQPRAFTEHYFDESWWHTYAKGSVKKDWAAYMVCDPGSGQLTGDRTCIWVFLAGPEQRLFVVYGVYDRLDPDQRSDVICRLIRRWHPRRWALEDSGPAIADIFYLSKRLQEEGLREFKPIGVGRKGSRHMLSKEARIRELRADFREGKIWWPATLPYKCVDGTLIDIVDVFKKEEYIPYRGEKSIPHDDGLDCLSRIHEPELRIEYVPPVEDRTQDRPLERGSWEAVW